MQEYEVEIANNYDIRAQPGTRLYWSTQFRLFISDRKAISMIGDGGHGSGAPTTRTYTPLRICGWNISRPGSSCSIIFSNRLNVLHVRSVLVVQDLMPNLDDNTVNLSVLAGLCTTFVSLFRLAICLGSSVIE